MNGPEQMRRKTDTVPPTDAELIKEGRLLQKENGMHVVVLNAAPILPHWRQPEGAPLVERRIKDPNTKVFAIVDGSFSPPGRDAIFASITTERIALEFGNKLDEKLDQLSLIADLDQRRTHMEVEVANHIRTALKSMNGMAVNNNRQRAMGPDRTTLVAAKVFETAPGERRLALVNIGGHRAYLWDGQTLRRLTEDDREPAGREHPGAVTEFIGEGEKANDAPVQFLNVKTGDRIVLISEDVAHVGEDELVKALTASRRASDAERAIQNKADALARDPRYGRETSGGFAAVVYEITAPNERASHPAPERSAEYSDPQHWRNKIPETKARRDVVDKRLDVLNAGSHHPDLTLEDHRRQKRVIAGASRERAELTLALADLYVKRARSLIPPRYKGNEKVKFFKDERSSDATVRSFDATTDEYVVEANGENRRISRFELESGQPEMDLPLRLGDRFILDDGKHPKAEVLYFGFNAEHTMMHLQWPNGTMGYSDIELVHKALEQEIKAARQAQLDIATEKKTIENLLEKAA